MRYRYMSRARRAAWRAEETKWMERLVANAPMYLEPWQRKPVDPSIEHIVTIEKRGESPSNQYKVTCTCGLDRGWLCWLAASQDAEYHRDHVRDTKIAQGLDTLPIPLVERELRDEGPVYRWACNCCSTRRGPWITSEVVAALGSTLHTQDCDARREQRDVVPPRTRQRRA
jgi:hypothetical protein